MLVLLTLFALSGICLASEGPPIYPEKARVARWLTHNVNAGVLSTTSIHLNGTAFGNPVSFADATCPNSSDTNSIPAGQLFFYTSSLDTSMQDIVENDQVSLTMSLQMYENDENNPGVGDYCSIHNFSYGGDAEDPRCSRLTISGKWRPTSKDEISVAKEVVFSRHPAMKDWPPSHDFTFNTLDITDIFLIDTFGGATILTAADYYNVTCSTVEDIPALPDVDTIASAPPKLELPPWNHTEYIHTARWLSHLSNYGVLSTTSVRLNGSAFGNVQSVVDGPVSNSTGRLWFFVSGMDASMVDLAQNPLCSFTLSEAWLYGDSTSPSCTQQSIDAEDPTCTRLVLSGEMKEVKNSTETYQFAQNALFSRHPTMASWPTDHGY